MKKLNSLSENEFVSIFGSVFEKSDWIANEAFRLKPFKNEEDLFLNEEDPHLEHTILPPKDRSETNEELPQLKQTLFTLI